MISSFPYRRECTAAGCRLRFPVVHEREDRERCPRCGAEAPIVRRGRLPVPDPGSALPAESTGVRLWLLADNVRSAYNVGSFFRTADGAGWHHLALCGICPTPDHPGVKKTALGAEEAVAWSYHPNAVRLAAELKAAGNELWALERTPGAVSLVQMPDGAGAGSGLVLAIGSERAGIDPALLDLSDRVVSIPMVGRKGSLNVAVAFGVAAYWITLARSGPE